MTIEVRIREEAETDGKRLCDWPIDRLDDLFSLLNAWGVYSDGEYDAFELSGEFRMLPDPHFEVVVSDASE